MFTAASKYDSFTARLHFMVGNLSCFDVRLSTADKKDLLQLVLQRQRLHPARAPAAALWSLTLSYVLRGHDGLISVGRSLALRTMTKLMTSCRSECICDWDYLPVFDPVNSWPYWFRWQSRLHGRWRAYIPSSVMNTWSVTPFASWWTRCAMLQCLEEVCLRDQKVPASTRAQSLLVPERSLQRPVDKDMLDIFGLNDDDDDPGKSSSCRWTSCWPRCDATCINHIRFNPRRTHPDQYDRLYQFKPIRSCFIGLYWSVTVTVCICLDASVFDSVDQYGKLWYCRYVFSTDLLYSIQTNTFMIYWYGSVRIAGIGTDWYGLFCIG